MPCPLLPQLALKVIFLKLVLGRLVDISALETNISLYPDKLDK